MQAFFSDRALILSIADAAKTAVSERSESHPDQWLRGLLGRDAGKSQLLACYWLPHHCATLRRPELLKGVKTPV